MKCGTICKVMVKKKKRNIENVSEIQVIFSIYMNVGNTAKIC